LLFEEEVGGGAGTCFIAVGSSGGVGLLMA
jgi:hypothetical protein